jgi:hypothetical protein
MPSGLADLEGVQGDQITRPGGEVAEPERAILGLGGQDAGGRRGQLGQGGTCASWLNLVEVFFAIIERQALRRGDFASVEGLVTAIRRFCDAWNQRCQPFTWTKDADQILAKLNRQTPQQRTTSAAPR